ncbi:MULTISPECIES: SDR family oxidoreductase [Streptomyces]|uniref:SDR family oxidoreductase n=1 Tax=Streptomyces caniscabiei TaxID=2746961 RepID=A0ABU4N2I4_9ACTN|nr:MULTISPECIES: SDR family oxidoreductase [Streptomyces]MBE4739688.1 SDR family oxidoreductase [Streptomyces caniscabiei]MBE4760298.1 SDR family oxidoreductase [Streptomyces caniscabiei]MBE4773675.1 SDR family oxidoreductase [Streptomyces caniscabiei]MBE4782632.1 SDR family oxidoreductase [Streptomyces caniscabiei]MBE4791935.1 SDR family oxidoreductase [Streptomyces caniscabiei]
MTQQRSGPSRDVVVVTGAGGMGVAIARRIGSGRTVLLADSSRGQLDRVVAALSDEGYMARGVVTDVSDRGSVDALAAQAAGAGRVAAVVHTAGVSAAQGSAETILKVDLLGTVHVIDAFEGVAGPGTAMVCVSSMAGHVAALGREDEAALATAPVAELLDIGAVKAVGDSAPRAYIVSKRANQLRVEAAALAWSRRGARINSVSPGIVATAMAKAEADGPSGARMLTMLEASGAGRTGTPAEIADAVAFLLGPEARYITGTDLLVDGGQAAWLRHHRPA